MTEQIFDPFAPRIFPPFTRKPSSQKTRDSSTRPIPRDLPLLWLQLLPDGRPMEGKKADRLRNRLSRDFNSLISQVNTKKQINLVENRAALWRLVLTSALITPLGREFILKPIFYYKSDMLAADVNESDKRMWKLADFLDLLLHSSRYVFGNFEETIYWDLLHDFDKTLSDIHWENISDICEAYCHALALGKTERILYLARLLRKVITQAAILSTEQRHHLNFTELGEK